MKRMTVDEVDRLFQAAANGDKVAIQRIDKFWRDQWRDYPDIAAEQDWPKSFADEVEKMKKKMAERKAIDDDPVNRMIRTRIRQDAVRNDPALAVILDMDAREYRQAVLKRMGKAIALPPQSKGKASHKKPQLKKVSERTAQIEELTGRYTIEEIAEKTRCSTITVWRTQRDLGLTTPREKQGARKTMKKK